MFSATILCPAEGERWNEEYIQLIFRTIIWFRFLPSDVNPGQPEDLPPLDVEEMDDELFSLVESLIFEEGLDGHIRIFHMPDAPRYSCWILPTQTNMTVWNNVKRS